ncbi:tRNA:m(4)X modification enzyme TRM13 homolog isoform X2 [Physella acuta]|nr:tRNA:m(4)X modification enzyme TRM13 homolog isoform X2 [Physella acuta]XP_059177610.1 tRNA:m(4)X modification enzyme TRM13 homolog isoform X2 [Physella acuta]
MSRSDIEDRLEQCLFYLPKKKRLCRFQPKPGRKYCPEHECITGVSIDRKRIPCPLNSSHNCYEDNLEKHLKKCNVAKIQTATQQETYYVKGINQGVDDNSSSTVEKVCVKDLTPESLFLLIDKVNELYKVHVGTAIETTILKHPCVCEELGPSDEDIENTLAQHKALGKELLQQASLVGQLDQLGLLCSSTCFVELGAGKGKLSHWIQKATKKVVDNSFVLVERGSVRYKMDSFHKLGGEESKFIRIKTDIENLHLGSVEAVRDPVVVVGKHLCGGATDMGLRCALNTLNQSPSSTTAQSHTLHTKTNKSEQEDLNIKTEKLKEDFVHRLPKGIMIALCCHHQCSWSTYVGKDFMLNIGLSPAEFDLLTRLSSWATCAKVTSKSLRHADLHSQSAHQVSTDDNLLQAELIEPNLEDLVSFSSRPLQREQLTVQQREDIGRKCKRLIDAGRQHFLTTKGMKCFFREYIDEKVTPENVVLIAIRE